MLQYGRIDMPEGIDVNKISGWCRCIICCYWYYLFFLEINSTFQPKVGGGSHNLVQKIMTFDDVVIFSAIGNVYRILFCHRNKDK